MGKFIYFNEQTNFVFNKLSFSVFLPILVIILV